MAKERLQRRLAAILSADVVGYSRLMGLDEAGTLSRLNALRRELINPTIAAHSGRIVKLMGDGALVEFASAVDAVTCAIEIQRQVWKHDAGGSEANAIQIRIGINVGDIIIEGRDTSNRRTIRTTD
jgi:class 3 adenylate cyclase